MRTLKLHFSDAALPTLDAFLKKTKATRVFRRAQAVRAVVTGQRLPTVSDTFRFTYSAFRKWVYRFAYQGVHGLVDRPRSGRPPKVSCELEQHLQSQIKRDECLKRQAWVRYRSWSRVTSSVLLSVLDAVQYGTSQSLL